MNIYDVLFGVKAINEKLGVLRHLSVKYPWLGLVDSAMSLTSLIPEWKLKQIKKDAIENGEEHFSGWSSNSDGKLAEFFLKLFSEPILDLKSEIFDANQNGSIGLLKRDGITVYFWKEYLAAGQSLNYSVSSVEKFKKYISEIVKIKYGESLYLDLLNLKIEKRENNFINHRITNEILEEINKFNDKNFGRSYLFYGPPGTGKSNITRSIADKFGSITFDPYIAVGHYFVEKIIDIISYFDSKIIIVDDIDSLYSGLHSGEDRFLSLIEKFEKSSKILIATCNHPEKLPEALLRPGRFDRVIKIDKFPEEETMKLVEGDAELFELCKNEPVACIVEFMKRVKVFGKMEAFLQKEEIFGRKEFLR